LQNTESVTDHSSLYLQIAESQSLWSRYDRHFVDITRYNALSQMAKIYRVIKTKLYQLVQENVGVITDLRTQRI